MTELDYPKQISHYFYGFIILEGFEVSLSQQQL
jgi:hypothetical protein